MAKSKKAEEYQEYDPVEEYKALQIRFPLALYKRISERAKQEHRSFNGEVIYCLEKFFMADTSQQMSAEDMRNFLTHLLYPKSNP